MKNDCSAQVESAIAVYRDQVIAIHQRIMDECLLGPGVAYNCPACARTQRLIDEIKKLS